MSLEQWEAIAEEFYRDTGFLRPGKDDAGHTDYEIREIAFEVWSKMRRKALDAEALGFRRGVEASAGVCDRNSTRATEAAWVTADQDGEMRLYAQALGCDSCADEIRALLPADPSPAMKHPEGTP